LIGSGCAGLQFKSETNEVAIDIAASTIGYLIGQKNLDQISKWNKWIDQILALEEGVSTASYEELLAKAFNLISKDPFLEMQFEKLLKLLEFPELQPLGLPYLNPEYLKIVKIVMNGFKDGLMTAQAAAKEVVPICHE